MPPLRWFLPLLPLIAWLPGCSGADFVNSMVPRDGYRVIEDLAYGPGPRQKLDVYIPSAAPASLPTILFFYGGGWTAGSKADYLFVGQAFAARGYAVVVADYRLYPDVKYPAFLEDGAAAVAWVKRRMAAETGAASNALYLMGHSAGAYNAAMLTLDGRWLAAQNLRACDTVDAFVGLAGPYDFLPLTGRSLPAIFGGPTPADTQPINYVTDQPPPMLLISGLDDTTVRPANSRNLAAKARAAGGTVEEKYYPDIGHIWLAGSLGAPLQHMAPTIDDVDGFLKKHPRGGC
jgi:acetyl esterase/lipase